MNCLASNPKHTFLQLYNCDYIRPPKPERFQRAKKQLFKPSYVLSHFVHYSTVTRDLAFGNPADQARKERFANEFEEGALIHTKSVLPSEVSKRNKECVSESAFVCLLGYPCPANVPFEDALHKKNIFKDNEGKFCNCWLNEKVEHVFLPQLEKTVQAHMTSRTGWFNEYSRIHQSRH
mmetsp:Transcript_8404/g.13006  ORF Transcript_8404/g.13006 Transcript_8404/m.13006 type:complete len:178 (+) Transcript_8404:1542-2075(+)